MKFFLILAICVGGSLVAATDLKNQLLSSEFAVYRLMFQKDYSSRREEVMRKGQYMENRAKIVENNIKYLRKEVSYRTNVNTHTDRLRSEITENNGYMSFGDMATSKYRPLKSAVTRPCIDWRDYHAVTEVKDQGLCGSCYAFAAAQGIEGQLTRFFEKAFTISAQRLVDCSKSEKNYGCNGGLMTKSFSYIIKSGGIEADSDYPYTGEEGKCKIDKSKYKVAVTEYVALPPSDENALMEALSNIGPICAGIDASLMKMAMYSSGVFMEKDCSCKDVNHAVLIVGYGTDRTIPQINMTVIGPNNEPYTCNGQDYWIIKNTWGPAWGEAGYIRIARKCNMCGVAFMPIYPKVRKYATDPPDYDYNDLLSAGKSNASAYDNENLKTNSKISPHKIEMLTKARKRLEKKLRRG